MFEMKIILGSIAVIITLIGYAYYFRNIFLGKTKPQLKNYRQMVSKLAQTTS